MTDLIPGQIEGWRVWRVTKHRTGLALNSVVMLGTWLPERPAKAWCADGREAPCLVTGRFHSCGLHAFNTERQALEYAMRFTRSHPAAMFAVGKVAGAGRVVEHELGWRAARAAVLSIDQLVTARDVGLVGHDLLSQLRRRYRLALTLEVR